MPERSTARSKRGDATAARKPRAGTGLEEENARLRAELAAAHARIAELELKNTEIINRIDWVIDSLHNLQD